MRKLLPFLILSLCTISSFGQTPHYSTYFDDTTLVRKPWGQIVNEVELSTGILWDHAVSNSPLNLNNGQYDSTLFSPEYSPDSSHIFDKDMAGLFQTLLELNSAQDVSDTMSLPPTLFSFPLIDSMIEMYDDEMLYYDAFPIVVYDFAYNQVDSASLYSTDITVSNGRFELSPNADTSLVFPERRLFELTGTYLDFSKNDTFPVVFTPGAFFSLDSALANYEIDFGDGNGYTSVQLGVVHNLNYPDSVLSGHTVWTLRKLRASDTLYAHKVIKFKAGLNQGVSQQTPTPSACDAVMDYLPDEAPWPHSKKTIHYYPTKWFKRLGITWTAEITIKHGFYSKELFNNKKAFGKAYIRYGTAQGRQNKEFRKVVVVVDGIDLESRYAKNFSIKNYNRRENLVLHPRKSIQIGATGWPMLWGCPVDGLNFQTAADYIKHLNEEQEYDIVFLDFWDSPDDMRRNAMLLVELIERINDHKVGDEGIVVIGASMGGQVARYALTYMEHNNIDHCVRLNVSYDSPWTGAIIPLAIQSFVHYGANEQGNASAQNRWNQLDNGAPKQLLLQHLRAALDHPSTTVVHNNQKSTYTTTLPSGTDKLVCQEREDFLADVQSMGDYPKELRNVAIINGANNNSNQNNQILNPGDLYIYHFDRCWRQRLSIEMFAYGRTDGLVGEFNFPKGAWRREYNILGLNFWEGKKGGYRFKDLDEIEKQVEDGVFDESPWSTCSTDLTPVNRNYTFIPSISALNLATLDPDFNIVNSVPIYGSSLSVHGSHFDAYKAPTDNESHIQATHSNMFWLLEQVVYGEQIDQALRNGLDQYWNVPLETKNVGSFSIISGGELQLYGAAARYDGVTNPLVDYSPNLVHLDDQTVNMHLGLNNCSSTEQIHIFNGGKCSVGDASNASQPNKVNLFIEPWSSVIVDSQGKLSIDDHSTLVVRENAVLDLRNNSEIELLGESKIIIEEGGELIINGVPSLSIADNAELIIQGKLRIEDNSRILYSGNGTIVFDQQIPYSGGQLDFSNHYEFGTNSKFRLVGTAGNRPQLRINNSCYLRDAAGDAPEVRLINTDIELAEDELLYLYNNPFIDGITADIPSGAVGMHEGIRVWGASGTTIIKNSSISNGRVGLWAQWTMGNNPIQLHNCLFKDNETAFRVEAGNFSIYDSDFLNGEKGIEGVALKGSSILRNSYFYDLIEGASLVGTMSTELVARNNTFLDCDGYNAQAMSIQQISAQLICNTFTSNRTGVVIGELGILDLQNNAYNVFSSNDYAIRFSDGLIDPEFSGLYLANGGNQFYMGGLSATSMHIYGFFSCENSPLNVPYIESNYSSTNPFVLDFSGNYMEQRQIVSSSGHCCTYEWPVSLIYEENLGGPQPPIQCEVASFSGQTAINSITTQCALAVGNGLHPINHTLQLLSADGGDVPGAGKLKAELINAINLMSFEDSTRNDVEAFQALSELALASIVNPDDFTEFYQELAYSTALTSLEKAYHSGQLSSNEGQVGQLPDSSMHDALNLIDLYILNLDTSESNFLNKSFIHHLNKILTLRNGGYTHEALTILANSGNWKDPHSYEQGQRLGYWGCIISAEDDYFNSLISAEELALEIAQCAEDFSGFTFKSGNTELGGNANTPNRTISKDPVLSVYPQPAKERVTLELSQDLDNKELNFTLYGINGRIVKSGKLEFNNLKSELSLEGLAGGTYILNVDALDFHELLIIQP